MMDFEPKQVSQSAMKGTTEFMVGVLLAGVTLPQIKQSIFDVYPDYEEMIIIMETIVKGHSQLNDLRQFWDIDDE